MGIESFGPARFQPYTITTGTGGAYATTDEDGNNLFGSGLNPALGGVSNQATEGAGLSQTAFQNSLANNQGGFNSPQFQSQYQGLGGGNQNYPMASNQTPINVAGGGGNAAADFNKMYGGGDSRMMAQPYNAFGNQLTNQRPQPSFGGGKGPEQGNNGGQPQMDTSFGYSEDAFQQAQMDGPQTGGPQGPNFGGGPTVTPFQNTAGNVGSFTPTEQPAVDQFQAQPFDINSATDAYFQQGMNVLNPAFAQQNSNLAQSLQGSGRGGLQLASGGQGAGGGGMMNPDIYQTGNAQSNAMANLYQQSRQSALGEQAQNFGQNLNTNQQQMSQMGQLFGQDATGTQLNAALQGQNYGQGLSTNQQQAALQGQNYGQNLGTEQQRMAALGQLFGQDLATGGQQFNQNLQGFSANQAQLQNMSGINQQQMANLGLFAGMEGDLFNQGLAAEQVRSGANAGSMYQPQQGRESTASRLGGALIGGLAGNENLFSGAGNLWDKFTSSGGTGGSSYYDFSNPLTSY